MDCVTWNCEPFFPSSFKLLFIKYSVTTIRKRNNTLFLSQNTNDMKKWQINLSTGRKLEDDFLWWYTLRFICQSKDERSVLQGKNKEASEDVELFLMLRHVDKNQEDDNFPLNSLQWSCKNVYFFIIRTHIQTQVITGSVFLSNSCSWMNSSILYYNLLISIY